MRAVHILAAFAALALGTVFAPTAQAQDVVEMAPPADRSSPAEPPTFEDIKLDVGTALPPKAGSAVIFNTAPSEWRMPLKAKRPTTPLAHPNR
ncbi:MAG: hypothetical protein K2Y71_26775 [Xanthobacteraceae bacterium]|nr:hypothetical protein [Xanthobacteraceae bacterium]